MVLGSSAAYRQANAAGAAAVRIIARTGSEDATSIYAADIENVRLSNPIADGETALLVRRNVAGTCSIQRVTVGASDSAGQGFRVLRVPN